MPEELAFDDLVKKLYDTLLLRGVEHIELPVQLSVNLSGISHRLSQAQSQFLRTRQAALEAAGSLLQAQINAAGRLVDALGAGVAPLYNALSGVLAAPTCPEEKPDTAQPYPAKPAIFNRQNLEEFAVGSMAKCFGPEFAIFEGRRHPRIPNSDLLLMDRVTALEGERLNFRTPAAIEVEYELPEDAWFFRDNHSSSPPYSILMEIGLQPCGLLSAYLGTALLAPNEEFFFRNLDGQALLSSLPDVRGRTITTNARLITHLVSGDTIIQKYAFALSCLGETFFSGQAVFGYFSPQAMASQMGLDGGRSIPPLLERDSSLFGRWIDLQTPFTSARPLGRTERFKWRLPSGQLSLIRNVFVSPEGGANQQGYAFASKDIDPRDWFYDCHFYQDPVMPGSLGVEAMLQTMEVLALEKGLADRFTTPRFDLVPGQETIWKYRGQILPTNKIMKLEAQAREVEIRTDQTILRADCSLWVDGNRIYEVEGAAISIREGY